MFILFIYICRIIISKTVDVNVRHQFGWTPLMVAAVSGHAHVCKVLLENGADPNLGDQYANASRMASETGLHSLEGKVVYMIFSYL